MLMQIAINEKLNNVNVIDGNDEIIEIDPLYDSSFAVYEISDGTLNASFFIETPFKLTTNQKGQLGQNTGEVALGLKEKSIIQQAEVRSYDLNVCEPEIVRIDVKMSMPHITNKNSKRARWEFWLYSRGQRKDYTQTCDALLCVGVKDDGSVDFFYIPSDTAEVRSLKKHISIPVNWARSKYARYHYSLQGLLIS